MDKIKLSALAAIIMFLVAGAENISASEFVNTLSTGLNSTVGNNIAGTVIVSPMADTAAGNYSAAQNIKLIATGSLMIRYTIDGAAPACTTGIEYSAGASILVNKSQTIKAIACYADNHSSPVTEFSYVINLPSVSSSSASSPSGGVSSIPSSSSQSINKVIPQVKGVSTTIDEGVQKPISQMTRAEKLAKIAEIRLLIIQLIQQLIIELQKQLLAANH